MIVSIADMVAFAVRENASDHAVNMLKEWIMIKLLLIASFMVTSLSGCYLVPYGTRDDGYRRDGDHHEEGDRRRDRDNHDDGRGGERRDHDGYH